MSAQGDPNIEDEEQDSSDHSINESTDNSSNEYTDNSSNESTDNFDNESTDDSTDFENNKEDYNYDKIEDMGVLNGIYHIDDKEKELFEGEYKAKFIKNKAIGVLDLNEVERSINCQEIYKKGRVMYKSDIEDVNIFDLIDLLIRYTYDSCSDLDLDRSIAENTQMMFGTICPTRKKLFVYKNREFTLYGRYIFGYDRQHVKIKNNKHIIKLRNPPFNKSDYYCDDYVYSLMIKNCSTNIVEAFGLYR